MEQVMIHIDNGMLHSYRVHGEDERRHSAFVLKLQQVATRCQTELMMDYWHEDHLGETGTCVSLWAERHPDWITQFLSTLGRAMSYEEAWHIMQDLHIKEESYIPGAGNQDLPYECQETKLGYRLILASVRTHGFEEELL